MNPMLLLNICIALELFEMMTNSNHRYNNLNVDQILSSERLVTNYVECLLSRKPCPPEGKDLKRKCSHYLSDHLSHGELKTKI